MGVVGYFLLVGALCFFLLLGVCVVGPGLLAVGVVGYYLLGLTVLLSVFLGVGKLAISYYLWLKLVMPSRMLV